MLFSKPQKHLFFTAEMDGIKLVVTRGDEVKGGAMVTRGVEGVGTQLTFDAGTCLL